MLFAGDRPFSTYISIYICIYSYIHVPTGRIRNFKRAEAFITRNYHAYSLIFARAREGEAVVTKVITRMRYGKRKGCYTCTRHGRIQLTIAGETPLSIFMKLMVPRVDRIVVLHTTCFSSIRRTDFEADSHRAVSFHTRDVAGFDKISRATTRSIILYNVRLFHAVIMAEWI